MNKIVGEVGEATVSLFSGSVCADQYQSHMAEMISLWLAEIQGISVCKLKRLRYHCGPFRPINRYSIPGDWNAAAKELRSFISLHSTFNAEPPLAEDVHKYYIYI